MHIRGFTIVELLIVIVTIAILASITYVVFIAAANRATTAARITELKQWETAIRMYIGAEGQLPLNGTTVVSGPTSAYCLGTGFISYNDDPLPDCRQVYAPSSEVDAEGMKSALHPSDDLNTMLAKYAPLPKGPHTFTNGQSVVGPYVRFYDSVTAVIYTYVPMTSCPDGSTNEFTYQSYWSLCSINIRNG
jgi:prepilin-type N-terminal cleavage/methylation domain-containing protein